MSLRRERRPVLASCLLAVLASVSAPVDAQRGPGRLEVELPTSELRIGDRFTVVLRVTVDDADALDGPPRFPVWSSTWGEAELVQRSEVRATSRLGRGTTFTQSVELVVFRTGLVFLPPPRVELPFADGTLSIEPETDLSLEIVSLLETTAVAEPRPALPPRSLPTPAGFWLSLGLLAAACAGLGALLARRRRRAREAARPVPPRLLLERDLARVATSSDPRHALAALSFAIRRFLAAALGLPALESTTTEIGAALDRTPRLGSLKAELVPLLTASDWVKFARHRPPPEAVRSSVRRARRLADTIDPEGSREVRDEAR